MALGGGGLALFGVGCLWTWPTHLTQVQARLTDKVSNLPSPLHYSPFKGHLALGGGGLALFGVGCLWTWPTHLTQVQARLTDKVSNLPQSPPPLGYCPFKRHVALGGGGLALFGVGCLWTWPTHLTQVQARLTDKVSNLPSVADP